MIFMHSTYHLEEQRVKVPYLSVLPIEKVSLVENFSPVSVSFFCQTKILVFFQFNKRVHLYDKKKKHIFN